jgi:peptidoglycan/xylan/chitin deacetylase (PgdA/CDA1 family)
MSVSRGKFLRSLGKAIPGMALGTGIASAAHTLLNKVASISGTPPVSGPAVVREGETAKIEFIRSGPPDSNRIALTFDDGPTPGVTDLILDELGKRQLPATFFMIGQRVAAEPALARRVLAEGHEVANHTFTHAKLTMLSDAQVGLEIQKTQDILREVLDHRPAWFRPPYGALTPNQARMVHKADMDVVLWNVDPKDWSQPGEATIVQAILADAKPGSIILCHDSHPQTASCVGAVLDGLLARELTFVTLSALLAKAPLR